MDGKFTPDKEDADEWQWHMGEWMDAYGVRHNEGTMLDRDLAHVDFAIIHVTDDKGDSHYTTLYGPFEDLEDIGDYLAYDFGSEGSLG